MQTLPISPRGSVTASGIARIYQEFDPIEAGSIAEFQLVELLQLGFSNFWQHNPI
ncbi:hypothetical protein JYQ62_10450 [Nostoc sp. UHCC 0702]|nr:hypothetical protein JYQ62_10450 [Nostoc sp. UHCC 0702]